MGRARRRGPIGCVIRAAAERIATAAFLEPAFPLFLLFLQEIISERHRLLRRNPGVSAAPRSKEQWDDSGPSPL